MILPQIAEKLAVIDVLDSSPKNHSGSEEWGQGSGVSEASTQLTAEHQAQILARRIPLPWAAANCKSFDIGNATLMLDYPAKSAGIMLMSDEYGQWQFRPDEPWASKDGKRPKYRTPRHEYDAFLAKHPEIEGYWRDLDALKARCFTINGKPYLLITEGGFKAITGCMYDIPTVALVGVTMGLTPQAKGEPELVPGLKRLAEAGFNFIIAFDADATTNKNVRIAEKKLAKALLSYGVSVRTVTGHWDAEEDGKGMDDFINNKGIEAFRAILIKSETYGLEPLVSEAKQTANKPPTPRQTAASIAEEYGHQWKFDNKQKEWRVYSGKHWEKVEIGNFETLLMRVIDAKNINYTGSAYLTDVQNLLTRLLREKEWGGVDRRRFINFSNCVLDGNDGTTRKHEASDRFTSYLPYEYKPLTGNTGNALQALEKNCPNISQWMKTAMRGDAKKMFKLLAIINGCLRFGFFGWQMFVHLIGDPGSGKGTFARLMEKVVGKDNNQPCSLDQLKDGSTLASIIDKQLVVFGDERKPVGIDSILRLTGGDNINYREVYKQAANAHFYGLLLICSNDPIFMGNTRGLDRRLCLVNFDNPIPGALRDSKVEDSFDSEIASLIAIALSLPDREVKLAIQGKGDAEIGDFKAAEWEMKVRMDSVAAFFEMELVVEEGASDTVGKLYERYKDFCDEIKKPAMSLTSFSPSLERMCAELQQPVRRDPSGRHVTFYGLRRRREEDEHPTYSQKLAALAGLEEVISSTSAPLDAGLAPILNKDLQDLQDLTPNVLEESKNLQQKPEATQKTAKLEEVTSQLEELPPPTPAAPVQPLASKAPSPASPPVNSPVSPAPSPATKRHHKEFKVGDRVRIVDRGLHHGKDGKVLAVYFGNTENDYRIALDKESHMSKEVTVRVPHSQKFPILMKL